MDNPEPTARLTVDKFGSAGLEYAPQLAELRASREYIETGAALSHGLLAVDVPAYARMIALYRQTGVLKSDIRADDLCDPSFIDQAHSA